MDMLNPRDLLVLVTSMETKSRERLKRLNTLAEEYRIHGPPHHLGGGRDLQITCIDEKWAVYVGRRNLLVDGGVEDHLVFLEHVDEIELEYRDRVLGIYDRLEKVLKPT